MTRGARFRDDNKGRTMRGIAIAFFLLGLLAGAARGQEAGASWLGVELKDLTKEEADALGWEAPRGAKLVKPVPGGPAEAQGLKPDDILVSLDGVEIESVKALVETVAKKAAGTEIKLAILRAGREKRLALKLGARPAQFAAAKPSVDAPLPVLDTGGHMALIRDIAFTPDGSQLVSASDDKTIRVWDVAAGKPLRTIRGEAEPGEAGKINAIALSPDGKWLAAGGRTHPQCVGRCGEIRLYDFASGKLVSLLKGHTDAVLGLAFSPESRHLISGSQDSMAIIWDVATRTAKHRLEGHLDAVFTVGFSADGARAVTGSYDHDLRLWSVESGALLQTMQGHGDKVQSVAFARDSAIASVDWSGEIRLWDGRTGAFLKTLVRKDNSVGSLSFSPDGTALLLSCAVNCGSGFNQIVYGVPGGREIVTYRGHDNSVAATAISPDGRWAATGGGANNEIHIWDLQTGERRKGPDGNPLTLGGTGRPVWAAGFSADGRQIAWGTLWESHTTLAKNPLQQALTLPSANGALSGPQALALAAAGAFSVATARRGTWSLSHRKGGDFGYDAILDIKEGTTVRASIERAPAEGYDHLAYSFTPDGQAVISGGGNGFLAAYALDGEELGNFIGHEGNANAIAPSPDGRYLVSGSLDQTVRLWNLKTRELLVTLFRGADGEWVMWTPQGFYASSPAGARLIGWQINHGPEHEAEYVAAAQLREHLNRPDIVAKAIELASAEEAVRQAHGADFKLADLLAKPVPRLRILSPSQHAALRGGTAQVTLELEATPDPVKLIRIHVNGRQIAERLPEQGGFAPTLSFDVPLAKGPNTISIAALNDTGETVAAVSVSHEGDGALDKRGVLYILAIGVDEYPHLPGNDLRYAGADAKAFAGAMEKDAGPLHEKVVKRVLVNGAGPGDAPTARNIQDALGMLRRAGETDTVMLFVSGHGKNEGPNYRFIPTDAAWDEGGYLRQSSVVPWYAFQEALIGAGGRRILFLDTCHSGNAFNARLLSDSYEANIVVYSSARGDQTALEDDKLGGGHGLFTYALVEGVNGGARDASGEVRAEGLRDFLRAQVTALAAKHNRAQEPQYFRARDAGNYVLARPQ